MTNHIDRFSNRVENYIKYRPGYPDGLIEILRLECGLTTDSVIADIGSGTGILTEMFLRNGNLVYGLEPNREMREAAERLLQGYPRFRSIAAKAEETTLPPSSVGFVTAGQAFHWFERGKARLEFHRILKPQGWIVLVWNEMQSESTPLMSAYEELLQTYAIDYQKVDHRRMNVNVIRDFFEPGHFRLKQLDHDQVFDYEGLRGRLLSSSYIPEAGHANYAPMLNELNEAFRNFQLGGKVIFKYRTLIYYGQLD